MDPYRDLLDSLGAIVWESDPDARRFVGLDTILPEDLSSAKLRAVIVGVKRLETPVDARDAAHPESASLRRNIVRGRDGRLMPA